MADFIAGWAHEMASYYVLHLRPGERLLINAKECRGRGGFRAGARPGHTSRLARAVTDDSSSGSGRHEQTEPRRPKENRSSKLELPSCLQGGLGGVLCSGRAAGKDGQTETADPPEPERKAALQEGW